AAVGCQPPSAQPSAWNAKTFVSIAPSNGPSYSGTYDFDLLGEMQGSACAEYGEHRNEYGVREVLVNGKREGYHVGLADDGYRVGGGSPLQDQAEQAAIFDGLSKLQGADVMFVTRSRVQNASDTKVCTTVWGVVARLKKGPTLNLDVKVSQSGSPAPAATASTPASQPTPSGGLQPR
ncbi:MAG TPA: hypothetical protein VHM19_21370, partial [Polyangiales bacterium]|nr:hypothetical protein [Polyangiales bacterium]